MIIGLAPIYPYRNISLIYNPFAGGLRGSRADRLDAVEQLLRADGAAVHLIPTAGPQTAGTIARERIAAGSDLIIAAGGDGTINEVVEGMVGSPVPLAILPAGTANVLANELGLGSRMLPAAVRIADCVPRRISIGQVQLAPPHAGRYFLLMAGAGLDAHVVFHLDLSLKARLGKVAYWVSGFSQFGRVLEEFDVAIDGRQHRCSLALISKVRNYGGDLEIAREVRLTDDQFEVVLFAGASSYAYLKYLLGVATRQTARIQGITTHRAGEVRLAPREGETVHLQVDGEYAGRLPGTIKLIHDALTLLIPPSYAPSPR